MFPSLAFIMGLKDVWKWLLLRAAIVYCFMKGIIIDAVVGSQLSWWSRVGGRQKTLHPNCAKHGASCLCVTVDTSVVYMHGGYANAWGMLQWKWAYLTTLSYYHTTSHFSSKYTRTCFRVIGNDENDVTYFEPECDIGTGLLQVYEYYRSPNPPAHMTAAAYHGAPIRHLNCVTVTRHIYGRNSSALLPLSEIVRGNDYRRELNESPSALAVFIRDGQPVHFAYHIGAGLFLSKHGAQKWMYVQTIAQQLRTYPADAVLFFDRNRTSALHDVYLAFVYSKDTTIKIRILQSGPERDRALDEDAAEPLYCFNSTIPVTQW